jgi:3,4-dihydroxy 2-butanone 4-phosphate synthase/GTP cyclohydrolase II
MLGHSADARRYDIAAAILRDLRVASIQLMTNNPDKIDSLRAHAIEVDGRVPIEVPVHAEGERYMATKARRMGHLLSLGGPPGAPARPR